MLINLFVVFLLAGTLSSLSLSTRNLNSLLSYLNNVDSKSPKKPVVLLLNSDTISRNIDNEDLLDDSDDDRDDGLVLAKQLRDREVDDAEAFDDLSGHQKQVLRAALRKRCKEVDKCQKKCPEKPKKKKMKCKTECTEDLDEENLCDEPNPCKKNNCGGRTMPPNWLL